MIEDGEKRVHMVSILWINRHIFDKLQHAAILAYLIDTKVKHITVRQNAGPKKEKEN